MAEIKEGILGPIKGKVGPVVGVVWRGRNVLRVIPSRSRKKATAPQVKQRERMSVVSSFASRFRDFVNAHYPVIQVNNKWLKGKEQLISNLLKQGIVYCEDEPCISVEKVLLSIGTLAPAVIRKINRLKTGKFKVQWDNSLINAMTLSTDTLSMMVYNEELDVFLEVPQVGNRVDKYAHFSLPEEWNLGRVYFWSMWKAADGSVHSTSCFHGILEMEEEETVDYPDFQASVQDGKIEWQTERYVKKDVGNKVSETVEQSDLEEAINENNEVVDIGKEQTETVNQTALEVATKENSEAVETLEKQLPTGEKPVKEEREGELKKWTPPGFIRMKKKPVARAYTQTDEGATPADLMHKEEEEPRSILEALKPE